MSSSVQRGFGKPPYLPSPREGSLHELMSANTAVRQRQHSATSMCWEMIGEIANLTAKNKDIIFYWLR